MDVSTPFGHGDSVGLPNHPSSGNFFIHRWSMCPNLAHLLNRLVLAVRLVYVRVCDQFMPRMVKDQVLQFVHVSNPEAVFVDVQLGVLDTRRQTDVHFYAAQIEPIVSRNTEAA